MRQSRGRQREIERDREVHSCSDHVCQAIIDGEFFPRNFYYVPTACPADAAHATLESWISNLRDRKAVDTVVEANTIDLHRDNLRLQRELQQQGRGEHEERLEALATQQQSAFVATLCVSSCLTLSDSLSLSL